MGHRIIEINGQSVVATAHEKIVQALSNSVGEVRLTLPNKTTQTHADVFRGVHNKGALWFYTFTQKSFLITSSTTPSVKKFIQVQISPFTF